MENGSIDNLELLFKTYFKRLVYFSYQIVANKENAEDIVQEVFYKFCNERRDIDAVPGKVVSYLYTSVRNASLNATRHKKVEQKYLDQIDVNVVDEDIAVDLIIRSEVIAELYEVIQSLPNACRKISILGFLEEKKNQEIAEQLGISITTVKSQKQRALQLMRSRLSPEIYIAALLLFLS